MFEANLFSVPCFLADKTIRDISGNALKILLIIIRKTRGFGKNQEAISLTQFKDLTLLGRATIVSAIAELEELKLVEVLRNAKGDRNASRYRLSTEIFGSFVVKDEPVQAPCPAQEISRKPTSSNSEPLTSSKTELVQNSNQSAHIGTRDHTLAPANLRSQYKSRSSVNEDLNDDNKEENKFAREKNKTINASPTSQARRLDDNDDENKRLLDLFVRMKSSCRESPRNYAAKIRSQLQKQDPFTLAAFEDFAHIYRAAQALLIEYKSKRAFIDGENCRINGFSMVDKPPYSLMLGYVKDGDDAQKGQYFRSVEELKERLEFWCQSPLPYFAVSTDKGGETASDASGDQAPLDPSIAAKLAETIAAINGGAAK